MNTDGADAGGDDDDDDDGGATSGDDDDDADGGGPAFDLPPADDGDPLGEDEGCKRVDFLFVGRQLGVDGRQPSRAGRRVPWLHAGDPDHPGR